MNEAEVRKIVGEEIARVVTEPSRIKYRSSSILSTIKNYGKKLRKLESSLEDAKNDLKNFKYGPGEEKRNGSFLGSYADVRLDRAVNRVARLEAEIISLTDGIKPENYISNRAIKLKNTMMKNFVKNSYNGYSYLSAKGYDKMFGAAAEEEENDNSYEEEKEKFERNVSEIEDNVQDDINEKIAAANAEANVDVNEVNPEETQESVDDTFDEEARSQAISESFDEEEVEEEDSPITPIINIQPREMSKVTPATVAKGVNDEFFGEEEKEERDVPVVVKDREEINYKNIALKDFIVLAELDAHIKAERDPKIIDNLKARFEKYSMELSDVQTKLTPEELAEVLQDLPEEVQNEIVVISSDEEVKEAAEETNEEVVEEPAEEINVVEEPKVVTKENRPMEVTTADSINVIKLLKQQNDLLAEKEAKVLEEQEALTAKYEEAKKKLMEKKKYLEETATERYEAIKKIEQENARRNAELNAIFDVVEGPTDTNEKKK